MLYLELTQPLSPTLQNPIASIPILIMVILNKVCLVSTVFNKYHEYMHIYINNGPVYLSVISGVNATPCFISKYVRSSDNFEWQFSVYQKKILINIFPS